MNLKLWIFFSLFILATSALANTSFKMQPVSVDIQDKAKLQRGAKLYMNYCSGCHSLRYMRYNRMAKDLGLVDFDGEIDKDLLFSNLVFTKAKIQDPIQIAMPLTDARQWFGVIPPDLSLVTRKRGATWVYNYLKSFYEDNSRPFHTNNLLIPNVAMPNILAPLIGRVIAVKENDEEANSPIVYLLPIDPGSMSVQEFDTALEDLVNFLVYVGEPAKLVRYKIGIGVLCYLAVFLVVVYLLKKSYWKKI